MLLVHQAGQAVPRDHFLRLPAVEAATGLKKSTIYLLQKRGEFPPCVQITPRCVAWPASKVYAWVQDRIKAAEQAAEQAAQPDLASGGGTQ